MDACDQTIAVRRKTPSPVFLVISRILFWFLIDARGLWRCERRRYFEKDRPIWQPMQG
jgi:hypothetical protein